MLKTEVLKIVKKVAKKYSIENAMFASFMEVESGGEGFSSKTGKIIIQFEPVWFKRKAPYAPSGKWSVNKVEVQDKEWLAFNDAFSKDPNAAMEATSIGMGQIMGFHWKLLGYKSVGEMWDDAKRGIEAQIEQVAKFILATPELYKAMISRNFHLIASNYNGKGYLILAKKLKREPYSISLSKAYQRYLDFPWETI